LFLGKLPITRVITNAQYIPEVGDGNLFAQAVGAIGYHMEEGFFF
jgi:hypothetical protein